MIYFVDEDNFIVISSKVKEEHDGLQTVWYNIDISRCFFILLRTWGIKDRTCEIVLLKDNVITIEKIYFYLDISQIHSIIKL